MAIVALCAQRARSAAHTKETAALTVVRKPCQSACSRPRTFASFPQNPDGLCQSACSRPRTFASFPQNPDGLCQSACSRPRTFANFPQNPDGLCQSACSRPRTFANFPQNPDGLCQSWILYPDPKHGLAGMLCASCTSCIGGSLIGMNSDIADVSCSGSAMWLTHQTYIFHLEFMSFRSLFTDCSVGVEIKDETIVLYLWPAGV